MGEARRRRAAIGNEVGTAFETTSGGSLPARYGGRLGEFLAGVDLAKPRPVPCNGCNHCCYYGHVNIDPAKERAEDLAHLDVVPHETGGFALRKREDGACIHLGPDGCTVYDHRPRACRFYDCRLFSLIGMVDTFDGGRHSPAWGFDQITKLERAYGLALRLAAAKHMASEPNWNANTVLAATFTEFKELLPKAMELVAQFESMPLAEQEKIVNQIAEHLRKRAA